MTLRRPEPSPVRDAVVAYCNAVSMWEAVTIQAIRLCAESARGSATHVERLAATARDTARQAWRV